MFAENKPVRIAEPFAQNFPVFAWLFFYVLVGSDVEMDVMTLRLVLGVCV